MELRLRRVHGVQLLGLLTLIMLVLSPIAPPRTSAGSLAGPFTQAAGVAAAEVTVAANQFSPESGSSALTADALTVAGSGTAVYLSQPITAPLPFGHVAPRFSGSLPLSTSVNLELRFGSDGETWGDWQPTDLEDVANPERDRKDEFFVSSVTVPRAGDTATDTNATATYVQVRASLRATNAAAPQLRSVTLSLINAGSSGVVAVQPASGQRPALISRRAWNPTDTGRTTWSPRYQQPTHIIIHHTGTSNTPTDWAAEVRAIWYAHSNVRGWGDIGYNFLIDPNGLIYEGRAGGDNVVGGAAYPFNYGSVTVALLGNYTTAQPSEPQRSALLRLLGWKVGQLGINPQANASITAYLTCGQSLTISRPTIAGARDFVGDFAARGCGRTFSSISPGDGVYSQLATIRSAVVTAQPRYNAIFLSTDSPTVMAAGGVYNVSVSIRNGGSLTWTATAVNPVRLGYRWFDQQGNLISGGIQDYRVAMPRDVPFGSVLNLYAKVAAPGTPGKYTLLWDMVEENVTWFYEQGATPLRLQVQVAGQAQAGDTTPPVSRIVGLKTYQNKGEFLIRWRGADEANGSGLLNYDVQYQLAPSGKWQPLVANVTATEASFSGQNGFTYYFRVRARDKAGNSELFRNVPDASTTIDTVPPRLVIRRPQNGAIQPNGAFTVTGEVEPGALVNVNGQAATVGGGSFTATLTTTLAGRSLVLNVTALDAAGNRTSKQATVRLQSNFSDVTPSLYARDAIIYVADRSIMGGFGDGTFRPSDPLTRAGAAKVGVLAGNITVVTPTQAISLSDVPRNDPNYGLISTAVSKGIISATNGAFRPKDAVTRAEFVRLVILARNIKLENPNVATFTDISNRAADYQYVETAVKRGLLPEEYTRASTFQPSLPVTRAEAAWMLRQSLR